MAASTKKTFQIRMSEEDIAMIKADAKYMGMTPGTYVAMVCRMLDETCREAAVESFASAFTKGVLNQIRNSD